MTSHIFNLYFIFLVQTHTKSQILLPISPNIVKWNLHPYAKSLMLNRREVKAKLIFAPSKMSRFCLLINNQ